MKSIRNVLAPLFILGGFVALFSLLHAQEAATLTQSGEVLLTATNGASAMSDLEVELKAIEMTTPLPASAASPDACNFYSAQHNPASAEAWPPLPGNIWNLSVWPLGDDFYLLDDLNVNYNALAAKALAANGGMKAMMNFAPLNLVASTNLWLAITNLTNSTAFLLLSNTVADVQYEIQGVANLGDTNWISEGFVFGSEITNWTTTSVAATNQPTLFLRVRSWVSSDGSGLPDWWELQYFGHTGVDPNSDPVGDGWTLQQDFQNNWNPNVFHTPPTPQGVTVTYNPSSNLATVRWLPSPVPVTGYTININGSVYTNLSSSANSFQIAASSDGFYSDVVYGGGPNVIGYFQVQAKYTGGNSAWSAAVPLEADEENANSIPAYLIPGQQGSANLVVSALPPGTVKLRVMRVDTIAEEDYGDSSFDTNLDIPVSLFTNGQYVLPAWLAGMTPLDSYGYAENTWWVQTVDASGNTSGASFLSRGYYDAPINNYNFNFYPIPNGDWAVTPFFDGREQIKQNLIFLLRANLNNAPIQVSGVNASGYINMDYTFPTDNYAYDSFIELNDSQDYLFPPSAPVSVFFPFGENYFYRNFVFTLADADADGLLASFDDPFTLNPENSDNDDFGMLQPPAYQFQPPTVSGTVIAPLLATNQTRWLLLCQPTFDSGNSPIGMIQSGGTNQLATNFRNGFGLQFLSTEIAWGNTSPQTYTDYPGVTTTDGGWFYSETAQPQFQTVEYDFWNPPYWPYLNTNLTVLPGMPGFLTTNKSQLLIASVGQRDFQVACYAKLAVTNGYSGVYGYLGQYFDQAYQINTNGVVTTNTTGILSPYGQFFPTQPGTVAMVTMPDPDTGARGTATVYCVSLNLDANHDGTMDTSFSGKDATSSNSPFIFWANNNYDRWLYDADDSANYEDGLNSIEVADTVSSDERVPDCHYGEYYGARMIPTTRDLQDFARLWIGGVTTNLLAALPSGSTVTLNWGDVGSPNPNNPTIDLFAAADPDGGIGYLTNSAIASNQINWAISPFIQRLVPGGSIQLNTIAFANNWAGNHFIWCGVTNGSGQLNLTVADANGNVLAQAAQWIQIVDIKQMYERWTVGDNFTNLPLAVAIKASNDLPTNPVVQPFQYPAPQTTNTPYILFVHGWNMRTEDKDHFAETAFKRLFWQGYQGRFGSFRWPTGSGFQGWGTIATSPTEKDNYDSSEYQAWLSAQGLFNKLNDLNTEYPGHVYLLAHSMGNVVAGEALRLAGTNQVVKTYVASQAAVSAHTYDTSIANYSFYYPPWSASADTPNVYGNWFAGNNGGGAGQVISFYNTNDFALKRSVWQFDQLLKPDQNVLQNGLDWNYHYNGSPSDPAPWNHFYKVNLLLNTGVTFDIVNVLTNRYEVMGYAAQSWTTALGATLNVANLTRSLNLTTAWLSPDPLGNNYASHFYHSAEFRGDTIWEWGYWNTLLFSSQSGFNINNP